MRTLDRLLHSFLALALLAAGARADVKMPAIFGPGMVLQCDTQVPVWGTADPGEQVTVSFAGQTAQATASVDGKWMVRLAPLPDSEEPRTMTVKGKNAITFKNVLVGEVWLCSGQSNMEWTPTSSYMGFSGIKDQEKEIASAKYPEIRFITVPKKVAEAPAADFKGQWSECTPATMKNFSAIGYLFGRELHQERNVPVGLIASYYGGTPAESWTRAAALEADAGLKAFYGKKWSDYVANFPQIKAKSSAAVAAWKKKADEARKAGKKASLPPRQETFRTQNQPGGLYNGMIAPLVPYALRGVIWYQGESNAGPVDAANYHRLFSTMITDWRAQWGQGDFPFLFVQLANYQKRMGQPGESSWAELRESQLKTLALPKTGMAVIIDSGEENNVHPRDKQTPAHRLALAAKKVAYGQDVVASGPIFAGMKVEGDKAVVSFKNVGGGLVNKAEGSIKGFAIAGADKKFVWAEAKVEGETVVVSSPQVKAPAAVRYAWANNPETSLYNKEGLPASPFRSDDWAAGK